MITKLISLLMAASFSMIGSAPANDRGHLNWVSGKIDGCLETLDGEVLYQFKSYDDEVWWLLTAEEIGYVPNIGEAFNLCYDDNCTTKGNFTCDCLPEWECECYLMDDTLIEVLPDVIPEDLEAIER